MYRSSSGGLHSPTVFGQTAKNFFTNLRAYEPVSPARFGDSRNRSYSPTKEGRDSLRQTMSGFSKALWTQNCAIKRYQNSMDMRLSKPKMTPSFNKHIAKRLVQQ